jgi:hypothetical protein
VAVIKKGKWQCGSVKYSRPQSLSRSAGSDSCHMIHALLSELQRGHTVPDG